MKPIIRVMLVDDEVLALRHIRNMIDWEQLGYQIVGEFTNPRKALDSLSRLRPDVVLADIKMPVMDGIALSSKMLEWNDKLKIILLTSYKEFDYAKSALKLGIFDYWVKHEVNADFLRSELSRLGRELDSLSRTQDMLRKQLWLQLVQGEPLTDENRELLQTVVQSDAGLSLMLLQIDHPLIPLSRDEMTVEDQLLKAYPRSAGEPVSVLDAIDLRKGKWLVVLQAVNGLGQRKVWEYARTLAAEMQTFLRACVEQPVSGAFGARSVGPEQLASLYRMLDQLLGSAAFFGPNRLLSVEEHGALLKQADLDCKHIVTAIKEAAEAGDEKAAAQTIQDAFRAVSAAADHEALAKLSGSLLQLLEELRVVGSQEDGFDTAGDIPSIGDMRNADSIGDSGNVGNDGSIGGTGNAGNGGSIGDTGNAGNGGSIGDTWNVGNAGNYGDTGNTGNTGNGERVDGPKGLYTSAQLCDWLVDSFRAAIRRLGHERAYSRKIRHTIEYMRKHYADDMTIEKLAEEVGISGEHLRHLFKEETGQTVLEYLTNIRIARAKRLLAEGRYKIYEVADMVGYRSGQYFSQVFRKATGVGPLDYADGKRKRLR